MEITQPKLEDLPAPLSRAVRQVGDGLAGGGHQAWVVGGAVRDLSMGRPPVDVDIATDATPDEVEAVFSETVPLGKRFGTVLVKSAGLGIEVTTLRGEAGYGDARRPESVIFGTSVEGDAERRDFTCNAMYLHALTGKFLDPAQGMEDLACGRLSAVGDPSLRFQEDGLRIIRLARFAATLNLEPTQETVRGATESLDSLRGVSGERMLGELSRGFECGAGAFMHQRLAELGVLRWLFPDASPTAQEDGVAVMSSAAGSPDLLFGLLVLLDPDPLNASSDGRHQRMERALKGLELLRPSRALREEFTSAWRLCADIEASGSEATDRGQRLLWMRSPSWETACELAIASAVARGDTPSTLRSWEAERASLAEDELFPDPWVKPEHLEEVGLPQGPRWGEVLREALQKQLAGDFDDQSAAIEWLRERAALN